MNIELTEKQFRRLIDLVYVGNWVLNSTRDVGDRISEYDEVESAVLSHCAAAGMDVLVNVRPDGVFPSKAFEDGGIHEAVSDYEDAVFFEILAEELARRDMEQEQIPRDDVRELTRRMDEYMDEFEANGTTNLVVDKL